MHPALLCGRLPASSTKLQGSLQLLQLYLRAASHHHLLQLLCSLLVV